MSEVIKWEQCVYGKLVQEKGGPIIPGFEHQTTGTSERFPSELKRFCYPSVMGLEGDLRLEAWSQYSWLESQGGILSKPIVVGRSHFQVIARTQGRIEQSMPKRYFTQAHYLAIPTKDWHFAAVMLAHDVMKTEPMVEMDWKLPPITMNLSDVLDLPLPQDPEAWLVNPSEIEEENFPPWLAVIAPIIQSVMSGQPISIQQKTLPLEDFLNRVTRCMACLPKTLSWRLSFGAGLLELNGSVSIAHGAKAMHGDGVRYIGKTRKDNEDLDLSIGTEYLHWLRENCSACRSLREVAEVVAQELPFFADPFFFEPEVPWQEVAKKAAAATYEIKKIELLSRWLDIGEGDTPKTNFIYFKDRLLHCIIETLRQAQSNPLKNEGIIDRCMKLLTEVSGTSWSETWNIVLQSEETSLWHQGLALLNNVSHPILTQLEPQSLPRFLSEVAMLPLSQKKLEHLISRLNQAVQNSKRGGKWLPLLQFAEVSGWVQSWYKQCVPWLSWLALSDRFRHQDRKLWDFLLRMNNPQSWMIEQLFEKKSYPQTDVIAQFLRFSSPEHLDVIEAIEDMLYAKKNYIGICLLAEALQEFPHLSGKRSGLLLSSESTVLDHQIEFAKGLFNDLLQTNSITIQPIMARLLVFFWQHLSFQEREPSHSRLRKQLEEHIGSPFAELLLFSENTPKTIEAKGSARYRKYAVEACLSKFYQVPECVERFLRLLPRIHHNQERSLAILFKWMTTIQRSKLDSFPLLQAIVGLYRGEKIDLDRALTKDETEQILYLCGVIQKEPKWATALKIVQSEEEFHLLTELWPIAKPLELDTNHIKIIFEVILSGSEDQEKRWLALASNKGWEKQCGWRLLEGYLKELDKLENEALYFIFADKSASEIERDVITLLRKGIPLCDEKHLHKITNKALSEAKLSLEEAIYIANLAQKVGLRELKKELCISLGAESLPKGDEPRESFMGKIKGFIVSQQIKTKEQLFRKLLKELNEEEKKFVTAAAEQARKPRSE